MESKICPSKYYEVQNVDGAKIYKRFRDLKPLPKLVKVKWKTYLYIKVLANSYNSISSELRSLIFLICASVNVDRVELDNVALC